MRHAPLLAGANGARASFATGLGIGNIGLTGLDVGLDLFPLLAGTLAALCCGYWATSCCCAD